MATRVHVSGSLMVTVNKVMMCLGRVLTYNQRFHSSNVLNMRHMIQPMLQTHIHAASSTHLDICVRIASSIFCVSRCFPSQSPCKLCLPACLPSIVMHDQTKLDPISKPVLSQSTTVSKSAPVVSECVYIVSLTAVRLFRELQGCTDPEGS